MTGHDDIEIEADETAEEAREWLLNEVRTRGARVAYAAAIEVCADPKAPAPARATMATNLFRVAGYFNTSKDDDVDVEPHNMTGRQLEREIARLKRRQRSIAAEKPMAPDDSSDKGVFN